MSRVDRTVWIAGKRGEALMLGRLYSALRRGAPDRHRFIFTAEDGTAAIQALDLLDIQPHECSPLCHPAEEPVQRLHEMIQRIEAFMRNQKATRAVFAGCGPTALAGALVCHMRGNPGLWLRPADPAGGLARLRQESGMVRAIEACAPMVRILDGPVYEGAGPELRMDAGEAWTDLALMMPGVRRAAPRVVVHVQRQDWGVRSNFFNQLTQTLAERARRQPDREWVILSNLNARIEAPWRTMTDRPDNLKLSPPLPWPVYEHLLNPANGSAGVVVLTDSLLVAGEARGPVVFVGDLEPGGGAANGGEGRGAGVRHILPEALLDPEVDGIFEFPLEAQAPGCARDQGKAQLSAADAKKIVHEWIEGVR